jgi:AraC-like DNA-binding protein
MTVYLVSVLPYYFKPFSEKIAIAQEIVNTPGFLSQYKFGWLAELFSNAFIYVSRPLLALCYVLWSIGMFIRFLKRKEDKWVFSGQAFMIKWLYVFLSSSLVLVASHFVMMIYTWEYGRGDLFFTINTLQVLSALGMTILLVSPFFFPEVLYGLPRLPIPISEDGPVPETGGLSDEGIAKYIPKFEADYLIQMSVKIDNIMLTEQPYSQLDLNMMKFSVMVDVPFHHLAYYFREVKQQSFNDFRNDWRINYTKKLILEGKADELTLEAIGLKAGFTSRSTFFRAFKKAEGIAPGEFLARISQNSSPK